MRLLVLLLMASMSALGQPYPSRPVTLVVPSVAGGLADVTARPFAAAMGRITGQNFVVDPKPGASGAIGIAHASRQKPDGYTLLWGTNAVLSIPEVDPVLDRAPSFQIAHFTPVALLIADEPVLAARADAPWSSVAELLADAKKRPGPITYGTAGAYSTPHLPLEMLAQAAGLKLLPVPFHGAAPALVATVAGQVDLSAQTAGFVQSQVRAGRLKLLASFGATRNPLAPQVPTLREQGIPVEFAGFIALYAPAGTPEDALSTLRGAARLASQQADFAAGVARAGSQVRYMEGPALQSWLDNQARRTAAVIRRMGRVE